MASVRTGFSLRRAHAAMFITLLMVAVANNAATNAHATGPITSASVPLNMDDMKHAVATIKKTMT